MGKVAIGSLAARGTLYSPFVRYVKNYISLLFRLFNRTRWPLEIPYQGLISAFPAADILDRRPRGDPAVPDVGILIVDDDIASQRALKNVLDSEGWRVRIVPLVSHALAELATGTWNLAIVNIALADVRGPLFAILKELAEAEPPPTQAEGEPPPNRIRALFLVPVARAKDMQPILEREGLPYSLKPYHLHDFLEKVSELLVEAGAIAEPIRSIGGFGAGKRRKRNPHFSRDTRRGTMFATREDYQMTDEEMSEYEREEEEGRKKREKELHDMKDRGGHS
jgi:CheY-like chemotaxis protein